MNKSTDNRFNVLQRDIFDVAKLVLALMVLAIHSGVSCHIVGIDILWPWLRVAVPIFFIMSSYFFFSRNENVDGVKKFVCRNFKLYGFWFIATLPVTLLAKWRIWFTGDMISSISNFVRNLLFGSTFGASWFIVALVEAVLAVKFLSKYARSWLIFVISIICYCIALFHSSYKFMIVQNSIAMRCMDAVCMIIPCPENSFLVAMIWVSCGRWFARSTESLSRKWIFVGVFLSAFALFVEWNIVSKITGEFKFDCYLLLLPICSFLFFMVRDIEIQVRCAPMMRAFSVVLYCCHVSVLHFLPRNPLKYLGSQCEIPGFRFFMALIGCYVIYVIIRRYEGVERFRWLRYSH